MTACLSEQALTDMIAAYAADTLGGHLQGAGIDRDANLADMGFDSIDVVLLTGQLEERFDIEIDPAFFLRHTTISAIMIELRRIGLSE